MPNRTTGWGLTKSSDRQQSVPRTRTGEIAPWVLTLARLRAEGYTSRTMLANRLGVSASRIAGVISSPEYQTLETLEALRVLGTRRARALLALGDKAEAGDVQAIRLMLELTGVIEAQRAVLVTIDATIGPVPRQGEKSAHPLTTRTIDQVDADRRSMFTKLFGRETVDVIFEEIPATNGHNGNGNGNGHHPVNGNGHAEPAERPRPSAEGDES